MLTPKEIVFIDGSLTDYQAILDSLPLGIEVHIVDPAVDGFVFMADTLAAGSTDEQYTAIHVISHGSPGAVQLGSAVLSDQTLGDYTDVLASINESTVDRGDMLLYGCDVAQVEGQDLIASIATVTALDVAASVDETSTFESGNVHLEFSTGAIESNNLLSESDIALAAPLLWWDKAYIDFDEIILEDDSRSELYSESSGGNYQWTVELADGDYLGLKFYLDNTGNKNSAQDSGNDYNNLSVSFKEFDSSSDKSRVYDRNKSSDLSYNEYFGSEAGGGDGYANYVMVEAVDTNSFTTSETNFIELRFRPENFGTFDIFYRTWANWEPEWSGGDENGGNYEDPLGFDAYRIRLNLVEEQDPERVSNLGLDETKKYAVGDPSTPWITDTTPKFEWDNASDNTGVAYYEWRVDGDDGESGTVGGTSVTLDEALSQGEHEFEVRAVDDFGNDGRWRSIDFGVDTANPEKVTGAVVNGATNPQNPTFTWDASSDAGAGIDHYVVEIDGGLFSWADSYSTNGDSTSLTLTEASLEWGKEYKWKVYAVDKLGKIGAASTEKSYTPVDTVRPTAPTSLTITGAEKKVGDYYDPGSLSGALTFTWSGAQDNESGLSDYKIFINGVEKSSGNESTWYSLGTGSLQLGENNIAIYSTDNRGNQSASAYTDKFYLDVAAPDKIEGLSSANTNTLTPTLNWDSTADTADGNSIVGVGIKRYEVKVEGGEWQNAEMGTSWEVGIDDNIILEWNKTYDWWVRAYDNLDHVSSTSKSSFKTVADDDYPANDPGQLTDGSGLTGTIEIPGDADRFEVTLSKDQVYNIHVDEISDWNDLGIRPRLRLLRADGSELRSEDSSFLSSGNLTMEGVTVATSGTYYLEVSDVDTGLTSDTTGEYKIYYESFKRPSEPELVSIDGGYFWDNKTGLIYGNNDSWTNQASFSVNPGDDSPMVKWAVYDIYNVIVDQGTTDDFDNISFNPRSDRTYYKVKAWGYNPDLPESHSISPSSISPVSLNYDTDNPDSPFDPDVYLNGVSTAVLNWDFNEEQGAPEAGVVRWREKGSSAWNTDVATESQYEISVQPGKEYEWEVRIVDQAGNASLFEEESEFTVPNNLYEAGWDLGSNGHSSITYEGQLIGLYAKFYERPADDTVFNIWKINEDGSDSSMASVTVTEYTQQGTYWVASTVWQADHVGDEPEVPSEYKFRVNDGHSSLWENDLLQVYEEDKGQPTYLSSTPEMHGENAGVDQPIVINFNENVELGSGVLLLRQDNFGFWDNPIVEQLDLSNLQPGQSVDVSGGSVTITFANDLEYIQDYIVEIPEGAVVDSAGNLSAPVELQFETTEQVVLDENSFTYNLVTDTGVTLSEIIDPETLVIDGVPKGETLYLIKDVTKGGGHLEYSGKTVKQLNNDIDDYNGWYFVEDLNLVRFVGGESPSSDAVYVKAVSKPSGWDDVSNWWDWARNLGGDNYPEFEHESDFHKVDFSVSNRAGTESVARETAEIQIGEVVYTIPLLELGDYSDRTFEYSSVDFDNLEGFGSFQIADYNGDYVLPDNATIAQLVAASDSLTRFASYDISSDDSDYLYDSIQTMMSATGDVANAIDFDLWKDTAIAWTVAIGGLVAGAVITAVSLGTAAPAVAATTWATFAAMNTLSFGFLVGETYTEEQQANLWKSYLPNIYALSGKAEGFLKVANDYISPWINDAEYVFDIKDIAIGTSTLNLGLHNSLTAYDYLDYTIDYFGYSDDIIANVGEDVDLFTDLVGPMGGDIPKAGFLGPVIAGASLAYSLHEYVQSGKDLANAHNYFYNEAAFSDNYSPFTEYIQSIYASQLQGYEYTYTDNADNIFIYNEGFNVRSLGGNDIFNIMQAGSAWGGEGDDIFTAVYDYDLNLYGEQGLDTLNLSHNFEDYVVNFDGDMVSFGINGTLVSAYEVEKFNFNLGGEVAFEDLYTIVTNEAPVLISKDMVSGLEDSNIYLSIGTPSDPNGNPLTITITEIPDVSYGMVFDSNHDRIYSGDSISLEQLQSLYFSPRLDFYGDAGLFEYEVSDGLAAPVSDSFAINVEGVNDNPDIHSLASLFVDPDDGTVSMGIQRPMDIDSDHLTVFITNLPEFGTVRKLNGDEVLLGDELTTFELDDLTYTSPSGFVGEAGEFGYRVEDEDGGASLDTFAINVGVGNQPPTVPTPAPLSVAEDAVATNLGIPIPSDADSELTITITDLPSNGALYNGSTGAEYGMTLTVEELAGLTYMPSENFNGDAGTFSYTVSDGEFTETRTVPITVTAVNDSPTVDPNASLILGNNVGATSLGINAPVDVDGDELTITVTAIPDYVTIGNGIAPGDTLTIDELVALTVEPDDFIGDVGSFQYTVDDGNGGIATQSIAITVEESGTVELDSMIYPEEMDSDQFFGSKVITDPDNPNILVVMPYNRDYAPAVYEYDGNSWVFSGELQDTTNKDFRIFDLAISNDTIAALAWGWEDAETHKNYGIFFTKVEGQWLLTDEVNPISDGQMYNDLALHNNDVLFRTIEEGTDNVIAFNSYEKFNGSWTFKEENPIDYDFGVYNPTSITMHGEYAVAGSCEPFIEGSEFADDGALHFFKWENNTWTLKQVIKEPTDDSYFGNEVHIDGKYVFVTADAEDIGGVDAVGAVYVYEIQDDDTLALVQKLVGTEELEQFGLKLAVNDGLLAVRGVEGGDIKYHIYELNDASWEKVNTLIPPYMGSDSLAITNGQLLIGDQFNDDKANEAGAVYVYDLSGEGGGDEPGSGAEPVWKFAEDSSAVLFANSLITDENSPDKLLVSNGYGYSLYTDNGPSWDIAGSLRYGSNMHLLDGVVLDIHSESSYWLDPESTVDIYSDDDFLLEPDVQSLRGGARSVVANGVLHLWNYQNDIGSYEYENGFTIHSYRWDGESLVGAGQIEHMADPSIECFNDMYVSGGYATFEVVYESGFAGSDYVYLKHDGFEWDVVYQDYANQYRDGVYFYNDNAYVFSGNEISIHDMEGGSFTRLQTLSFDSRVYFDLNNDEQSKFDFTEGYAAFTDGNKAYVYSNNGGIWEKYAELTKSDYGIAGISSIALDNNELILGSQTDKAFITFDLESGFNTPPSVVGNLSISVEEDSAESLLSIPSPVDHDGDLLRIQVEDVPAHGRIIKTDGTTLTVGQQISVEEYAGLKFVTDMDNYYGPAGQLLVMVIDGKGGMAEQVVSIDIAPTNDVPTLSADKVLTLEEDSGEINLGITPPSDIDGDLLTITISGLPLSGILRDQAGVPVYLGQALTAAQLAALMYLPEADFNGDAGQFAYDVFDGTDVVTGVVSFQVTPVDDPVVVAPVHEDPGSTRTAAHVMMPVAQGNTEVVEVVGGDDTMDYYKFEVVGGSSDITISLEDATGRPSLTLYDSRGRRVARAIGNSVPTKNLADGEYYINVAPYRGAETGYSLNIDASSTNPAIMMSAEVYGNDGADFMALESFSGAYGDSGNDVIMASRGGGGEMSLCGAIGGTGDDTYIAADGNIFIVADFCNSSSDTVIADGIDVTSDTFDAYMIDGRHLNLQDTMSGQAVCVMDWKDDNTRIETFKLGSQTYSFEQMDSMLQTAGLRNYNWEEMDGFGLTATAVDDAMDYYRKKSDYLCNSAQLAG